MVRKEARSSSSDGPMASQAVAARIDEGRSAKEAELREKLDKFYCDVQVGLSSVGRK